MLTSKRGVISPNIDKRAFTKKLVLATQQTISFLESKLNETGSYGEDITDIACYFKSPMLFLMADKPEKAEAILKYIEKGFMLPNGDFKTSEKQKSSNNAYNEYWCYTNGWIVRAATQLKMKSISYAGYKYLKTYDLGIDSGFSTNQIGKNNPIMTDVLTVAHHGLINLENGELETAHACGKFLCKAMAKQPTLNKGFFLRFNQHGEIIKNFPNDQKPFYFISTTETNQLHFMIGYPAAFLAILYTHTKNASYLQSAKAYLDFSLSCHENIYECDFSHKIAWAASLIYKITQDNKYLVTTEKICNYFITKQDGGMWFKENPTASFDQSAEITCWFLDIINNIKGLKKKERLTSSTNRLCAWNNNVIRYAVLGLFTGIGLYAVYRSTASLVEEINILTKSNSI